MFGNVSLLLSLIGTSYGVAQLIAIWQVLRD